MSSQDLQFYISIAVSGLCLVVGGIQAHYAQKSFALMIASMSTKKRNEYRQKVTLGAVQKWWPLALMILLSVTAWIPYWLTPDDLYKQVQISSWGPDAPMGSVLNIDQLQNLKVTADGSHASTSTRNKYRVAAIAMHYDGTRDANDVEFLVKSNEYDIADGVISILIPISPRFRADYGPPLNWRGTGYALLLVPKEISMDKFSTLRQAQSLGVKILGTGGGGP
jgi:hypothetical protein